MTRYSIVARAIIQDGDGKKVSRVAIKKRVRENTGTRDVVMSTAHLNRTLKNGVKNGHIIQIKESFKLSESGITKMNDEGTTLEKRQVVAKLKRAAKSAALDTKVKNFLTTVKKSKSKQPTWLEYVSYAIDDIGKGRPVSRFKIKQYIKTASKASDHHVTIQGKHAIRRGLANGALIQVKGSFKLSPKGKALIAKPKTKTTTVKGKVKTKVQKSKKNIA